MLLQTGGSQNKDCSLRKSLDQVILLVRAII